MSDALSEFVAGIVRFEAHNDAVLANTDIIAAAIGLTNDSTPGIFRIQVCFNIASTLTVRRTNTAVTVSEVLNTGVNLTANALYTFDVIVAADDTINIQYGINATALSIKIVEIRGMM